MPGLFAGLVTGRSLEVIEGTRRQSVHAACFTENVLRKTIEGVEYSVCKEAATDIMILTASQHRTEAFPRLGSGT